MENNKPGFFGSIAKYVGEVVIETRKVTWPSRKDLYGATVVLIFVGFMLTVVLGVIDWAFGTVLMSILTSGGAGL
ncbi:MAG: preprotein translocase subunit SecE [Candidatus Sumerlaeales bacterium]|nr:preprotein translocase subunit SecE [Candidatus Sumerlaeales bacterium]